MQRLPFRSLEEVKRQYIALSSSVSHLTRALVSWSCDSVSALGRFFPQIGMRACGARAVSLGRGVCSTIGLGWIGLDWVGLNWIEKICGAPFSGLWVGRTVVLVLRRVWVPRVPGFEGCGS